MVYKMFFMKKMIKKVRKNLEVMKKCVSLQSV